MEFKEDTSVTFQNWGPDRTVPLRLGIAGWVADKAYLAGCFAGLNYRGMGWHSLDVKIVPRNSHFLFHRWNIFIAEIYFLFIHRYYAQTLPLRKSSAHINVFSVLLPWIDGGEPVLFRHRKKKYCLESAVELEEQTLLNYSGNLSCFLCWSVCIKGLVSASEEPDTKIA